MAYDRSQPRQGLGEPTHAIGASRSRARGSSCAGPAFALGALALCALWAGFAAALLALTVGSAASAGPGCQSAEDASLPVGPGVVVAATVYSGAGLGAYGAGLAGHLAFAELGLHSEADTNRTHADRIGRALGLGGPLAPFTRLDVTAPNGRTVLAEKRDIGMGGPPIAGHERAIDLWTSTRQALGLPPDWSGLVRVSLPPGETLATETGVPAPSAGEPVAGSNAAPGCAHGSVGASEVGQRIVAIARSQLGAAEQPDGSNCTIYGPCEPWCALFVTWVWQRAGVAIPRLGFSGAIYDWAARSGRVLPPGARPQPGWAALIGSGPAGTATSVHVAIVESVLADGDITLINGNFANRVMRTGPCLPRAAALGGADGCEEPGPIYAYAAPE